MSSGMRVTTRERGFGNADIRNCWDWSFANPPRLRAAVVFCPVLEAPSRVLRAIRAGAAQDPIEVFAAVALAPRRAESGACSLGGW